MPSCYHKQMDERNIRWLGIVDYSRRTPQGRITNGHNEILYDARRMYASVAAIDTNPLQIQNKETLKVPSVAELPLRYATVARPRRQRYICTLGGRRYCEVKTVWEMSVDTLTRQRYPL
jgi:hypothetical protein